MNENNDELIVEEAEPIEIIQTTAELEGLENPDDKKEKFVMTAEDCERFYGVIMETSHSILSKKGHRELPEARRTQQGKLLHRICEKYNIVIPTEFDVVILGAAAVADWQYMSRAEQIETEKIEKSVDIRESGGIRTDDTIAVANHELN